MWTGLFAKRVDFGKVRGYLAFAQEHRLLLLHVALGRVVTNTHIQYSILCSKIRVQNNQLFFVDNYIMIVIWRSSRCLIIIFGDSKHYFYNLLPLVGFHLQGMLFNYLKTLLTPKLQIWIYNDNIVLVYLLFLK